jgi:hypothetical protein
MPCFSVREALGTRDLLKSSVMQLLFGGGGATSNRSVEEAVGEDCGGEDMRAARRLCAGAGAGAGGEERGGWEQRSQHTRRNGCE